MGTTISILAPTTGTAKYVLHRVKTVLMQTDASHVQLGITSLIIPARRHVLMATTSIVLMPLAIPVSVHVENVPARDSVCHAIRDSGMVANAQFGAQVIPTVTI